MFLAIKIDSDSLVSSPTPTEHFSEKLNAALNCDHLALINDLGTQVLLNGLTYLYWSLRTHNVQRSSMSQFLKIMLFWKFRLLSPSCDIHVYGCCCLLLLLFLFLITSDVGGTVTQHSLEERTGHGQILLKGGRQDWRIPGWMGGPLQRWSRARKPPIPTGSLTGLPEGSGHRSLLQRSEVKVSI